MIGLPITEPIYLQIGGKKTGKRKTGKKGKKGGRKGRTRKGKGKGRKH